MVFGSVLSLLFIDWHFETQPLHLTRKKETFGYLFCPLRLTVLELAPLEKKKKENEDFRFFSKFVFLASIKLSWNQRTCLYSGGSGLSIDIHFVDLEVSYDVLSPLPIVLSKHFNHPHPYLEITTMISDYHCRYILSFSIIRV